MDIRAHHAALVEFLLPYQDIWRNEIMLQYPRSLAAYDGEWVADLRAHLAPDANWELLQGRGWERLSPALRAFHARIAELCVLPRAEGPPFPALPQSWVHIIPKKQHEIERLAPLVDEEMRRGGYQRIVDIGGGQGHLAQSLAHHYGHEVLSLDLDAELQRIGIKWQQAKWENSPTPVTFRPHKVERNDAAFTALLGHHVLSTGLHTCGGLALAQIEAAAAAGAGLMNLGCCYHKLADGEWNLSQGPALPLNLYALTLAAGAHRKVTVADVAFRHQVKRFRYALHMYLVDEHGIVGNVTLGNCPPALYQASFAAYAREQLNRLGVATAVSDAALNAYSADTARGTLVQNMIAAGIVRDVLGRPLELAILLDRARWLEEQSLRAKLVEVFDPAVSPRNILLSAWPSSGGTLPASPA